MKHFNVKILLTLLLLMIANITIAGEYFDGTYSNVINTVAGPSGVTYTFKSNGRVSRHYEGIPLELEPEMSYDINGDKITLYDKVRDILIIRQKHSIIIPPGIMLREVLE